jgi:uncharacterized GH25 family protein
MSRLKTSLIGGLAFLAAAVPTTAGAHRAWMLPSATVLSGTDQWVTVDAAISNDLFYFDHQPARLEGVRVIGPDGAAVKIENGATGRYRSTFDARLATPGTYKISNDMGGLFASYTLNGERKRWRGTAAELDKAIPAGAQELQVSETINRNEAFVTLGAPTQTALKPTGRGLELVAITHPNDLVVGEAAKFRFTIDGKPAAQLKVSVIPGGARYRDALGEQTLTTDANGEVSVDWPNPGMYWINASTSDDKTSTPRAQQRRLSYAATLEVLAP